MSGWISAARPFSYEWAVQHMAFDAGRRRTQMEEQARDRDETRRLLYMALYASRTDRYELVGTLVNALTHHGSGLDAEFVAGSVIAAIEDADPESLEWLRSQIARLTAEEQAPPQL